MSQQSVRSSMAVCEARSRLFRALPAAALGAVVLLLACGGENPQGDGGTGPADKNSYSAADPVTVSWTIKSWDESWWNGDLFQVGATADFSKLAVVYGGGGVVTWTEADQKWFMSSTFHTICAKEWNDVWTGWCYTLTEEDWVDSKYWKAVASSDDGSNLIVAPRWGFIFTSADFGAHWVVRRGPGKRNWKSIVVSSRGDKVAALTAEGHVLVSGNSGDTWAERTLYQSGTPEAQNADGRELAASSDGKYLAAVINGGHVYTSDDFGQTWIDRSLPAGPISGNRNWSAIASSANGAQLAATINPGYIYTSNDYGATWKQRTSIWGSAQGQKQWTSIASSPDGKRLVAVDYDTSRPEMSASWELSFNTGHVFVSVDSGELWTDVTKFGGPASINYKWGRVLSSGDGSKFALVARYDPYPHGKATFNVFIMEVKVK